MLVSRFAQPLTSPLCRARIIPSLVPSAATLCARYSTSSPPSPSPPTSSSSSQRRNLQTVTAYHPPNLPESAVLPPRNADAPPSPLTGSTQTPAPPPRAPAPQPARATDETPQASPSATTSSASTTSFRPSRLRTPRKAAMTLTPSAISQLHNLLLSPDPKLIRIGVKNRGCSGLAYNLEYVDKPGKFDEEVVQDGVKVLIDSKALFSIIGSEMDWVEDKLCARFVFKNPNIKEQCGCGESFSVGH